MSFTRVATETGTIYVGTFLFFFFRLFVGKDAPVIFGLSFHGNSASLFSDKRTAHVALSCINISFYLGVAWDKE